MTDAYDIIDRVLSRPPIHFSGREHELGALRNALLDGDVRTVLIHGPAGIGKSALVHRFTAETREHFTGGIHGFPRVIPNLLNEQTVETLIGWGRRDLLEGPRLLTVEESHVYAPDAFHRFLRTITKKYSQIKVLATSQVRLKGFDLEIALGPLNKLEMQAIWQANLVTLSESERRRLYETVGGNPLISTLAGRLVRDQVTTVEEIGAYFRSFSSSGLLGADGRPVKRGSDQERALLSSLVHVSDDLFDHVSRRPSEIHLLTSRQFEELVAEMFSREGYEVELTQASKDGGKDIYVAKRDALGSMMYLVECKKYAPNNPVEVGVIRQLYGIVEQEKATGGVVATTSFFTRGAQEFTQKLKFRLALKDYLDLHRWILKLQKRKN